MAAIAGMVTSRKEADAKNLVTRMLSVQAHRGADSGCFCFETGICLGKSARPSALTPEAKSRAASNEADIQVFLDGAIYNLVELREYLRSRGLPDGDGDEEDVVKELYRCLDAQFLDRLRGDFALAILDRRSKRILLAKDKIGFKPLFYYINGSGELLFASELKALLKSGATPREIDPAAVYHYLFFTFFRQPQTPLKGIKSLLPAHYLIYDIETKLLSIREYWDLPHTAQKTDNENSLIHGCQRLLLDSIERRAGKSASVGVSLSGGIDSSVIAAFLTKLGRKVKTYTFGFAGDGEELNEFHFSRAVSRYVGTDHHEIRIGVQDLLAVLPQMVWDLDTPSAGTILPYLSAKAAGQLGIDVTFRGDGAHSAFEAPAERKFHAVQKLLGFFDIMPNGASKWIASKAGAALAAVEPYARGGQSRCASLTRLLSGYFKTRNGKRNLDIMFSDKERRDLFVEPAWESDPDFVATHELVLECMGRAGSKDLLDQMIYEEYKRFIDQGLGPIDTAYQAYSVDLRQPYMDQDLVEFIQLNMPLSLRMKNGVDKYILKKICRGLLPDEVVDRPQHPFRMPFDKWLRGGLRPLVEDVLSRDSVTRRGLFNYEQIRRLIEAYYAPNRPYFAWRKIWSLIVLEMWFRLYVDRTDLDRPTFALEEMLVALP